MQERKARFLSPMLMIQYSTVVNKFLQKRKLTIKIRLISNKSVIIEVTSTHQFERKDLN
jgi:hypothetical protein